MSENGGQSAPTWFDRSRFDEHRFDEHRFDESWFDESWFEGSWRPRSLRPARQPWLTRRNRVLLLAGVVLLHLFGAYLLYRIANRPNQLEPGTMRVDFVFEFPPPPMPPPPRPATPKPPDAARTHPRTAAAPRSRRAVPAVIERTPVQPAATAQPSIRLQLYDADGRLKLSKQVMDDLDKRYGDSRSFSYQIPRMGDAQKVWGRIRALPYEPTRFAQYWKPDQDILTALLTEMVEKTTKEISVPVPGRPDARMVCKISLLALGGGCGVLIAGSDYLGPQDDPATLSEDEQKQCQAWWDQITAAKTQDAWRSTRKLYDAECRKPRERKPSG